MRYFCCDARRLEVIKVSGTANGIVICDAPGKGILIQSASGAKISITDEGITIDNGQGAVITLNHNTVSLNGSALTVT